MEFKRIFSRRLVFSIITGAFLLIGSIFLARAPIDFRRFSIFGFIGIFLATFLGSATLFFPVPNISTVFAGGVLFNPLGVALASGLGSTLGETTGYLAGVGGGSLGVDARWRATITGWISRNGMGTIFLFALIPNPFFDLVGLASGYTRYPLYKFLLATLLGKTLRSLIIAYSGSVIH